LSVGFPDIVDYDWWLGLNHADTFGDCDVHAVGDADAISHCVVHAIIFAYGLEYPRACYIDGFLCIFGILELGHMRLPAIVVDSAVGAIRLVPGHLS
jgi:hypothetical protein